LKDIPYPPRGLAKGNWGEGENEEGKNNTPQDLSLQIQWGNVVQGWGMAKAKQEHQNDHESPPYVEEEADSHPKHDGQTKYDLAFPTEQGIGNMPTVQLTDREEV